MSNIINERPGVAADGPLTPNSGGTGGIAAELTFGWESDGVTVHVERQFGTTGAGIVVMDQLSSLVKTLDAPTEGEESRRQSLFRFDKSWHEIANKNLAVGDAVSLRPAAEYGASPAEKIIKEAIADQEFRSAFQSMGSAINDFTSRLANDNPGEQSSTAVDNRQAETDTPVPRADFCDKHQAAKFRKKSGVWSCRACVREYQRDWAANKKREAGTPPPVASAPFPLPETGRGARQRRPVPEAVEAGSDGVESEAGADKGVLPAGKKGLRRTAGDGYTRPMAAPPKAAKSVAVSTRCERHDLEKERTGNGLRCPECMKDAGRAGVAARRTKAGADKHGGSSLPSVMRGLTTQEPSSAEIAANRATNAPPAVDIADLKQAGVPDVAPWNDPAFVSVVRAHANNGKAKHHGEFYVLRGHGKGFYGKVYGLQQTEEIVANFLYVNGHWTGTLGQWTGAEKMHQIPPAYYAEPLVRGQTDGRMA